MKSEKIKNKNKTKENFCGACIAAPVAIAGAAGAAGSSRGKNKSLQLGIFIGSVVLSVLGIVIALYYLYPKNCMDCA